MNGFESVKKERFGGKSSIEEAFKLLKKKSKAFREKCCPHLSQKTLGIFTAAAMTALFSQEALGQSSTGVGGDGSAKIEQVHRKGSEAGDKKGDTFEVKGAHLHQETKTRDNAHAEEIDSFEDKYRVKVLDVAEFFDLAKGHLDKQARENLTKEVKNFLSSLSQEEIKKLEKGEYAFHVHAEADSVRVIPYKIHGVEIKNNRDLAQYRSQVVKDLLQEVLKDSGIHVKEILVSFPEETGISEKNQRIASIEVRKLPTAIGGKDLIAVVMDNSGSIQEHEVKKMKEDVESLEKKYAKTIPIIDLEGKVVDGREIKDFEAHYKTLKNILDKVKTLRKEALQNGKATGDRESIVLLETDERDASLDFEEYKKYPELMRNLMKEYKDAGIRVLAKVFAPDNSGNYILVDLTEHPDALMVNAATSSAFNEAISSTQKGAKTWFERLKTYMTPSLKEYMSGISEGNEVQVVKLYEDGSSRKKEQAHDVNIVRDSRFISAIVDGKPVSLFDDATSILPFEKASLQFTVDEAHHRAVLSTRMTEGMRSHDKLKIRKMNFHRHISPQLRDTLKEKGVKKITILTYDENNNLVHQDEILL